MNNKKIKNKVTFQEFCNEILHAIKEGTNIHIDEIGADYNQMNHVLEVLSDLYNRFEFFIFDVQRLRDSRRGA